MLFFFTGYLDKIVAETFLAQSSTSRTYFHRLFWLIAMANKRQKKCTLIIY